VARRTEHAGAKKGCGADYGRKRDAKRDSAKSRRRNDDALVKTGSREEKG